MRRQRSLESDGQADKMSDEIILGFRKACFLAIGEYIQDSTAPTFGLPTFESCTGNFLVDGQ